MRKIFFIFLLIPLGVFSQDKVKFIAGGVTCSMCSNAIQKSLSTDKNIKKIDVNLDSQEWLIEYKDNTFKLETLKKGVEDAGFSLIRVWKDDKVIFDKKKKK